MLNKANLAIPHTLDLSAVAPVWVLGLEKTDLGASYRQAKANLTRIFRRKLAKVLLIGALVTGEVPMLSAEESATPITNPDQELFNPSEQNCNPVSTVVSGVLFSSDRTVDLWEEQSSVERFKTYQALVLEAVKKAPGLIGENDGAILTAASASVDDAQYNKLLQVLLEEVEAGISPEIFNQIVRYKNGRSENNGPRVARDKKLTDPMGREFFEGPDEKIEVACWEDLSTTIGLLLAAEDHEYFDHGGANSGVMLQQGIKKKLADLLSSAGLDSLAKLVRARGASSITMQLIKHLLIETFNEKMRHTMEGKLLQARFAIAFEDALVEIISERFETDEAGAKKKAKEIILFIYLNTAYFGQHRGVTIHGIEMAALTYFGKPLSETSDIEKASLIKTIPNPKNQPPGSWGNELQLMFLLGNEEKGKAMIRDRYQTNDGIFKTIIKMLLQLFAEDGVERLGDLAEAPAEIEAVAQPLSAKIKSQSHLYKTEIQKIPAQIIAETERIQTDLIPQHAEAIWDQVRSILAAQGKTPEQIAEIFRGKITVTLTLHRDAQRAAMAAVREQVNSYINDRMDGTVRQNQVQASQFIVDPITGKIVAAVTSNPNSPSYIDYTTRSSGSIGSTMKPIAFAYGLERSQRAKEAAERLRQTAAELNATNPNSAEAHAAQAEYEAAKNAIIDASPNMLLGNNRADSNFFRSPDENVPLIPQAEFFRGILEPDQLGLSAAQLGYSRLSYPFNLPNKTAWDPTNYDDIFTQNRIPAWVMLKHSYNLSAINYWLRNIYEAPGKVGNDFANWLSSEFQFSWDHIAGNSKIQPSWGGAFILGTGEFSAESLAYFYAAVTNGGQVLKSDWQLINSIEVNGKKVWEAPPPRFESVMSEQTAFLAHWMLQRACQEGTSGSTWRNLLRGKYQTCGAKTGTGANFSGATHAAVIDGLTVISRMMPDTREGLKSLGSGNSAAALAAPMTGLTLSKLAENNVSVSDLLRPPAGHEYDQASRLWLPEQFSAGFSSAGTPSASGSDTRALPEDPVGYQRTDAGFFVPVGYRRTQTGLWQPPVGIGWERQDAQILSRFKETTPLRDFLQQLERELADFRRIQKKAAEKDLPDLCTVEDLAQWIQNDINQTLEGATENPRAEFSAENPKLESQIESFCSVEGVLAAVRGWFAAKNLKIPSRLKKLLERIEADAGFYSAQSVIRSVTKHEEIVAKQIMQARELQQFAFASQATSAQELLDQIHQWRAVNSSYKIPKSLIRLLQRIEENIGFYSPESINRSFQIWFSRNLETQAILPRKNVDPRTVGAILVPFYQPPTQPD